MLASCETQEVKETGGKLKIVESDDVYTEDLDIENENQVFNIKISKNRFYPAYIQVDKGDSVLLRLTSDQDTGFELDAFDIRTRVPKDIEVKAEFVADKKGSYTFSCGDFCEEIKEDASDEDCSTDSDCLVDDEECMNGICRPGEDADVLGLRLLRGKLVVS